MKACKKLAAVFLIAVLAALCLTACPRPAERDPELIGVWVTEQSLTMEQDLELTMDMCLKLEENGKMTIYVTDDAIRETCTAAYEKIYGSYTDEEISAALKAQGYASEEACVDDLFDELMETVGGIRMEGIWTSHAGQIITYETEEDFQNNKPSADGSDAYELSEDGQTLTLEGGEMVFQRG